MSDSKASALNPAAALTGAEIVPVVQAGNSVRTTAADLRNSAGEPLTFALQNGVQSSPGAGKAKLFFRNKAGRALLEMQGGATGEKDTAFQPALAGNMICEIWPLSGTSYGMRGSTFVTIGGTYGTPTLAEGGRKLAMRRFTASTGTTAGTTAGVRSTSALVWRGNAADLGGFYFFLRFGFDQGITGVGNFFAGLTSTLTAIGTTAPHTSLSDHIGLTFSTGDASGSGIYISSRTGNGTATRVQTVATRNVASIYDLTMWCAPNSDRITMRLFDQTTQTAIVDNVAVTATLPAANAFLAPQFALVTSGTNMALEIGGFYLESDL